MSQIWPCLACGRVSTVDDDGHCPECQHAEQQLVTDGGIGPIGRIEDIEYELHRLFLSLKTGESLDLKTRQYEVAIQIDRLRSDLTHARVELVQQEVDKIFEEVKSQRNVADRPITMEHGYWKRKANENVDEWGLQDIPTLLLAMQEEQGELAQAYLESEHEGGNVGQIAAELDDLAALCIQLRWRLEDL